MKEPTPTHIKLLQKQRLVIVTFDNGFVFNFPCEYLRVFSPSAEVQRHGASVLVTGKENVNIVKIEPVGQYAVKFEFDDGHNTGIYSWHVLHELGQNYKKNWQDYLERKKSQLPT